MKGLITQESYAALLVAHGYHGDSAPEQPDEYPVASAALALAAVQLFYDNVGVRDNGWLMEVEGLSREDHARLVEKGAHGFVASCEAAIVLKQTVRI